MQTYWAPATASDTQDFLEYVHADYQGWAYDNPLPGSRKRAVKFITLYQRTTKTLVQNLQPVTVRVFGDIAYVHYFYTERRVC